MSELKYYKLFHRASALTSPNFISVAEFGCNEEVYLKSEADRYIVELKQKIDDLENHIGTLKLWYGNAEKALLETEETCANLYKDNDRQKRKRCLAMARWCRTSAQYERSIEAYEYSDFYRRWYWKWSELADKFKETK